MDQEFDVIEIKGNPVNLAYHLKESLNNWLRVKDRRIIQYTVSPVQHLDPRTDGIMVTILFTRK